MADVVYLTAERARELEQELHELKTKGRKRIADKIAEARSHGDLSENAEYEAAKHEQELHEMKIANLERTLMNAQIIKPEELPNDKIYILSKVKMLNQKTNKEMQVILVSPEEADFEKNKMSVTSPIGKALLGKKIGDEIDVKVPAGTIKYKILEISR
jgi:transcription elongation factor GreA